MKGTLKRLFEGHNIDLPCPCRLVGGPKTLHAEMAECHARDSGEDQCGHPRHAREWGNQTAFVWIPWVSHYICVMFMFKSSVYLLSLPVASGIVTPGLTSLILFYILFCPCLTREINRIKINASSKIFLFSIFKKHNSSPTPAKNQMCTLEEMSTFKVNAYLREMLVPCWDCNFMVQTFYVFFCHCRHSLL